MASPIRSFISRQKRPLFQDDKLRRGGFAPRVLVHAVIAGIADIAGIGKANLTTDQHDG